MKKSYKLKPAHGFTLVELLVVIAIILVLASLVFVGSRRAFLASKAAGTVNNLRAVHSVLLDVKEGGISGTETIAPGRWPGYAGNKPVDGGGGWISYNWMDLVGEQIGIADLTSDPGNIFWISDPSETILQNPLSRHKLGHIGGKLTENKRPEGKAGSGGFTYNNQVGDWIHASPSTLSNPDPSKGPFGDFDFPYPELTILIGEANDRKDPKGSFNEGNKVLHALASWGGDNSPQGNYRDKAHVIFLTGHVQAIDNDILKSEEGREKYFVKDGDSKTKPLASTGS